MTPVLQSRLGPLPRAVLGGGTLPGVEPVTGPWLFMDDAYDAQMRRRMDLLATRPAEVMALRPEALGAAQELLDMVLAALPDDFARVPMHDATPGGTGGCDPQPPVGIMTPDGRSVPIDRQCPLATLNQLIQQDVALLQKRGDEHVLSGALLCFPASWSLAEKFNRPLGAIHDPVAGYGADMARRVQRLFDMVRADQPLWRANALRYADAELFQPRRMAQRRDIPHGAPAFLRSERQTLLRLPQSDAVAFVIHTTVVRFDDLDSEMQALFAKE